jgi:protein-S-isoprenylcysteine O-methyltransferase Ste14
MTPAFLRAFLPVYLLLFFGAGFVWRTVIVWRSTGRNPYRLSNSDSAHDYVGFAFRLLLAAVAAMIVAYAALPDAYAFLLPVVWLERPALAWAGVVLLLAALAWTLVAQANMGAAWRIGVDAGSRTELVQRGLFSISRNPIFLGMRVMLLGCFLVLPNALSFAALAVGEVLMQVQVRLEEAHLAALHGAAYREYCRRTRRWL